MRAVVLHEYGGPEKLKFEDNVPEPQISGSTVLIAAAAASVNPIDWKLRSGMRQKGSPLSFPAILGRDVSGIVRAVGVNVKHFKAGDRVLALSNATYAELVAVNDSDVAHLPDGVDLANAAAIPLISLTGDQLVRLAANVQKGQVVLITGALGSVGRAAVHTAKKIGAQVIAGVRGKELDDARSLGVSDVLAIDDDKAIENFRLVDAIVDTVGGDVAAKLIAKVSQNGCFGYAATLPESAAAQNPTVKISRVRTQPDPSKLREFADDVRDGKFVLPIGRRMPLRDAAEAHVLGRKAALGRSSCWRRILKSEILASQRGLVKAAACLPPWGRFELALAKVTHRSHWVGVASHDHVLGAVQGGFCQLGHGKEALVRRLKAGDLIVFYSPRELMGSGPVLQAFTAAGCILDEFPYEAEQSAGFRPYRRRTKFFKSRQAPVRPLLQELTFTKGNESWGLAFRRGAFRITADDFKRIVKAMSIKSEDLSSAFAPEK